MAILSQIFNEYGLNAFIWIKTIIKNGILAIQIPDSPPDKSTETSRFSAFSFHFRSFLAREVLGNIFDSNSDSIGEFADIYRDSENNHTEKRLI